MMQRLSVILFVVLILGVAHGLRVRQLEAQSLWYDEGVAYGHSQRDLFEMIPMLQNNVHVPAYFFALAVWEDVTGESVFSMRYLSVLFSVLSVALTFALGKRLYGTVAGIASAGFVALNAFSIHYAQEIRMYAMLAMIATASAWFFVGFVRAYARQQRVFTFALAFAVTNALGMYTHFSYALVMVAQGVMAVLWLLALLSGNMRLENPYRKPVHVVRPGFEPIYTVGTTIRALMIYVIANLITISAFYPWIEVALRQTGSVPNYATAVDLTAFLTLLQGWFAFGMTYETYQNGMAIVVYFLILFGLVLLPNRPRGEWWRMLLPVVWLVVSVGLYIYFDLWERYLRFLLPAQIAFALIMGRGMWILWHIKTRERRAPFRYLPRVAMIVAVGAFWYTLWTALAPLYNGTSYPLRRDDFKGLAEAISAQATPTDAVIVASQGVREVFGYYYRGLAPVFPLPSSGDLQRNVETIAGNAERVFAVYYGEREHDPDGVIERTLATQIYPIEGNWWRNGGMRYYRYARPLEALTRQTLDVTFGGVITLAEYGTTSTTYQAGELVFLELAWRAETVIPTRYKVFVQLLDANGVLVTQRDSEPQGNLFPTTDWQVGDTVIDHHALELPVTLASGAYTVIVGWYDPNSPQVRLPIEDDSYLTLMSITIR